MTQEAQRRQKVAALVKAGKSERQIARELGVSRTTVWNDKIANRQAAKATKS